MSQPWQRGLLRGDSRATGAPTVLKWGGSLFARPSWPADLHELLVKTAPPPTLVVGGGPLVDGLRLIDRVRPGPPAAAHWLAVDAMGLTARLVAAEAGLPLTALPADRGVVVLDVAAWLRGAGCRADLPAGWEVTSDSIAAAVAQSCRATLLLAKSVGPPGVGGDLAALAARDWVDPHFPLAARTLATIAWAAPAST
jgi:aspartokinase-like uncharacterized kinase